MNELLKKKGDLFGLIHQFNIYPAIYTHCSWVEDLFSPALFEKLKTCNRGVRRLSKLILDQYHLSSDYYYDFNEPKERLALIPKTDLQQLITYCGLALQHRKIVSVVERSALKKIKEAVGEKAYQFTLKRVPLILGSIPESEMDWNGQEFFLSFIQRVGTAHFFSQLSDCPSSVLNRLILKFPKSTTKTFCFDTNINSDWQFLKRILIHEVDPKWNLLFS